MTAEERGPVLPGWIGQVAAAHNWEPPAPDAHGVLSRGGTSDAVSYPEEALTALHAHGGTSWWHEHRLRWAVDALARAGQGEVVDVGAGSGAMASGLARAGLDVLAVEPLYEGARLTHERGVPAFVGRLSDLALPDATAPTLGYFDVLEHLEAPDREVAEAYRVLRPRGLLLATVPAYPWLWSREDVLAGHVRRYTRASLTHLCEAAGFSTVHTGHLFASLVLPALLLRRLPDLLRRGPGHEPGSGALSRQLSPSPAVTRLARAVLGLENALDSVVPLPFGLSVVGVFRKPVAGPAVREARS